MSNEKPEFDYEEPREFNYAEHELMHAVQLENLVLEVYEVDGTYRWALVDCYGREHNSADGFETDAHALRAGLNIGLKD